MASFSQGFLDGLVVKNLPANAGDVDSVPGLGILGGWDDKEFPCNVGDLGSILGLGRSPRGDHGNPPQYSCLENPHGQRSLEGSIGSQRVGHNWAPKHTALKRNIFQNLNNLAKAEFRVGDGTSYLHPNNTKLQSIFSWENMLKIAALRPVVFPGSSVAKNPPAKACQCLSMQEMRVQSLGWKNSLDKELVTHSGIFAYRISWTEEPGWLQSMGLQRVGGTRLSS